MPEFQQTVLDRVDSHVAPDTPHFLRDVSDRHEYDFMCRHLGTVRTKMVDGQVCHTVNEQFNSDADGDSLAWTVSPACPEHGTDRLSKSRDRDDAAGHLVRRFTCAGDDGDCPFELSLCQVAGRAEPDSDLPDYGDPDYKRPLWASVTVPHQWGSGAIGPDDYQEILQDDGSADRTSVANAVRRLLPAVARFQKLITDDAYVSPDDGEDFIQQFDCARCGDTHDVGAEQHHPGFDDPVCRACQHMPIWTMLDAELPDSAQDALDAHEAVSRSQLRILLRDVYFHPAYIASAGDERTLADVPACPTGRGGKRSIEQGGGRPGTGLRRPDGALYSRTHWRAILAAARDAGLIQRVDDEDVPYDHQAARWRVTDAGQQAFEALAHCQWCGQPLEACCHEHAIQLSRFSTTTDYDLVLICPDRCHTDPAGSMSTLERADH